MLYLIGLGLGDAKDITVKGLEIVKKSRKVYLENYTSILCCDQSDLENLYGRSVTVVDREMMEQGCKEILDVAENGDAAVLVVGDPLNATTHSDLLLRAASRKIPYQIIHNASILNAVACCGLQIYSFGETISIPFWTDTWKPESYYDKILRNRNNNLHTLCLLDIKVKEPNLDKLMRGIKEMEPARFMSFSQAAQQLVAIIRRRKLESETELPRRTENFHISDSTENQDDNGSQSSSPIADRRETSLQETTVCLGLARVGCSTQQIVKTTLVQATEFDLGPPLHSLVIPGSLHPIEEEMINLFSS